MVVFSKNKAGVIKANVLEILSKKGTSLNRKQTEIAATAFYNRELNKEEKIAGLDANIFFYDENYKKQNGFEVTNGAWEATKTTLVVGKNKDNSGSGNNITESVNCVLWGLFLDHYDQNGILLYSQLLYTYWVCEDDGCGPSVDPNESGDPGEGGGGGWSADLGECGNLADNEMSLLVGSAQISSITISELTTNIDNITKTKDIKWMILDGAGAWSLHSHEHGIVKLVDVSQDKWQWESLTHGNITKSGITPGGEVSVVSHSGTPSFVAGTPNVLYAGMSVSYEVKYVITPIPCPPFNLIVPPVYRNYVSNGIWSAHP